MPSPTPNAAPNALTAEEEVTLRRVAYGQSEVRVMRARDLARLRALRLIEDGKDGPHLTASGRKHFDTLPRASAQFASRPFENVISEMTRLLDHSRR
jgi:hypothetical protein